MVLDDAANVVFNQAQCYRITGSALRRLLSMIPIITKHYGIGLISGIGFGLFLASMLIDSGVVTDDGTRRLMGGGGVVAMMVGGILYALSLRKPPADK